jgi:pimeloyl-ACP methyl ester carboxylesterase
MSLDSGVAVLLFCGAGLAAWACLTWLLAVRSERLHPPLGNFIEIDGVKLHYIEQGAGEPLVLLHGNGATSADFIVSGLVEHAARRYRVIVFDRPGYGYSARGTYRCWSPRRQAMLLHKALIRLGVDRPLVLGHSFGTLVAAHLALIAAANVRGLILLAGFYFPIVRFDVLMVMGPAVPVIGDVLRYTLSPVLGWLMLPAILKKIFGPSPIPARFASFPMALSMRPFQLRSSAIESALLVPWAHGLAASYARLSMPVAIVAAGDDQLIDTRAHSACLHRLLLHSDYTVAEGAGHMLHYTHTDLVMAAIDRVADRTR